MMLLWQEQVLQSGKDLGYGEFCKRVSAWRQQSNFVMRLTHKLGEKLFVDYSGLKVSDVERETGEERETEVFVVALGAISYISAEAKPIFLAKLSLSRI